VLHSRVSFRLLSLIDSIVTTTSSSRIKALALSSVKFQSPDSQTGSPLDAVYVPFENARINPVNELMSSTPSSVTAETCNGPELKSLRVLSFADSDSDPEQENKVTQAVKSINTRVVKRMFEYVFITGNFIS